MLEYWRVAAYNAEKRPDRVKIHTYTVARKNAISPGTILTGDRKGGPLALKIRHSDNQCYRNIESVVKTIANELCETPTC